MSLSRTQVWSAAYASFGSLWEFVRARRFVAELIFGVTIVSQVHDHLWDSTTLTFRKALNKYVKDGQRLLDLGTGHIGVLAIYCAKHRNVDVVAVDINERFVENARKVAFASNAGRIDFLISEWFSNVSGRFDLVVCNIPYIPSGFGRQNSHHRNLHSEVWDGGDTGCRHIETVLSEAPGYLSPGGRLLLGVDPQFVPRSSTLALLEKTPGLALEETINTLTSPSEIYVIRENGRLP